MNLSYMCVLRLLEARVSEKITTQSRHHAEVRHRGANNLNNFQPLLSFFVLLDFGA